MKVIDLINELFDYRDFQADKLPKKIRFNNKEFAFVDNSYYTENGINIMAYVDNTLDLRVEIEIIEDTNKIHKLNKLRCIGNGTENETKLFRYCYDLEKKLGEVIDAVNELKNTKK